MPSSTEQLPAMRELEAKGIPHRVFVHHGPVRSLEQAAEERGQKPEQVVRSLLFRLAEGEFALVLVAGPQQVPWKALRQHFGQRRLTMASEEEVFEETGYVLGAVSPFGLPRPLPIYLDQSVLDIGEVSLGSGRRGRAIVLQGEDLRKALPEASLVDLFASSIKWG